MQLVQSGTTSGTINRGSKRSAGWAVARTGAATSVDFEDQDGGVSLTVTLPGTEYVYVHGDFSKIVAAGAIAYMVFE